MYEYVCTRTLRARARVCVYVCTYTSMYTVQVSDILVLTVCFKIINFTYQIFPLFVPALSISFTSYIFQTCITLFLIL